LGNDPVVRTPLTSSAKTVTFNHGQGGVAQEGRKD
jgi:hypothetical protein